VQIFFGAISMYHLDYTINRCWSRALGSSKGKIPVSAAGMAVIEAKVAIPEDTQACYVRLFSQTYS